MQKHSFVKEHYFAFAFLYRSVDLMFVSLSLFASTLLTEVTFTYQHSTLLLGSVLVFLYFSDFLGLYHAKRGDLFRHVALSSASAWSGNFIVVVVVAFLTETLDLFPRTMFFYWFAITLASLIVWRFFLFTYLDNIRKHGRNTRTYAIIGGTDAGMQLKDHISNHPELGLNFRGFFDDRRQSRLPCERSGSFDEAIELARSSKVDQLYITLSMKAEDRINDIIFKCGDTTCDVYIVPDLLVFNLINSRVHHIGEQVSLSVFESPYFGNFHGLKRTIDIVFSVMILTLIAIPMLIIAAAIKFTSGGPIIFKQRRYGLGGKSIEVWKFRTMTTAENGAHVKQASKNDPRITPLGGFLRKHSLDELPQFINVLKGDMSIVGPRPHAVAHNEEYRRKVSYYMLRHKVKPGITGWAQINGWRGETDTLEKMQQRVEHDLEYIRRWSPWFDIKIIFLTVIKGFTDDNAY